jgi:hypothetical protein
MDEAWRLERELWEAAKAGEAGEFYARHLTADGFVVLPGMVLERHELILKGTGHTPVASYELSEPRMVMVDGGSVLITYQVTAQVREQPEYRAHITALYTLVGSDWALAFRQHTPEQDVVFPF